MPVFVRMQEDETLSAADSCFRLRETPEPMMRLFRVLPGKYSPGLPLPPPSVK